MQITLHMGFISFMRLSMAEVLFSPTLVLSAQSWRFKLLARTTSPSTNMTVPTNERAIASAAPEPTPPTPTIATHVSDKISVDSFPSSRSLLTVYSTCAPSISILRQTKRREMPFRGAFLINSTHRAVLRRIPDPAIAGGYRPRDLAFPSSAWREVYNPSKELYSHMSEL